MLIYNVIFWGVSWHSGVINPHCSRSAAAYSDQTFTWTICQSVCGCIMEKRQIGSRCRLAS